MRRKDIVLNQTTARQLEEFYDLSSTQIPSNVNSVIERADLEPVYRTINQEINRQMVEFYIQTAGIVPDNIF